MCLWKINWFAKIACFLFKKKNSFHFGKRYVNADGYR